MYVSYTGMYSDRTLTKLKFRYKFNKWGSYVGLWKNRVNDCLWIVPGTLDWNCE